MKFSIKDIFSNIASVIFTEEILNGKLYILSSETLGKKPFQKLHFASSLNLLCSVMKIVYKTFPSYLHGCKVCFLMLKLFVTFQEMIMHINEKLYKGSLIQYVSKVFPNTDISYVLLRTRRLAMSSPLGLPLANVCLLNLSKLITNLSIILKAG